MNKRFSVVSEAIIEGNMEEGVKEVKRLLSGDVSPKMLLKDCIEPTLDSMGEQFSQMEVFLPELINAADVVNAVKEAMVPYIGAGDILEARKVVAIGTVYGDVHSIGKNMVALMLQLEGFEVHDMGVDLHPQTVVEQVIRCDADLLCLSALLMTSKLYMRDTIEMVRNNKKLKEVKIMVGGGTVDEEWAEEFGADGYAPDAVLAAKRARKLLEDIAD